MWAGADGRVHTQGLIQGTGLQPGAARHRCGLSRHVHTASGCTQRRGAGQGEQFKERRFKVSKYEKVSKLRSSGDQQGQKEHHVQVAGKRCGAAGSSGGSRISSADQVGSEEVDAEVIEIVPVSWAVHVDPGRLGCLRPHRHDQLARIAGGRAVFWGAEEQEQRDMPSRGKP